MMLTVPGSVPTPSGTTKARGAGYRLYDERRVDRLMFINLRPRMEG